MSDGFWAGYHRQGVGYDQPAKRRFPILGPILGFILMWAAFGACVALSEGDPNNDRSCGQQIEC